MKNKSIQSMKRTMLGQFLNIMLVCNVIYGLLVLLGFLFHELVQRLFVLFFSYTTFYQFLDSLLFLLVAGILLMNLIVITYYVWKMTTYIERIGIAMETLGAQNEISYSLPSALAPIETILHSTKQSILQKEQLAKQEAQRKSDLIAYLAHDIKTPLASIIGYLSLLEEAYDMPLEQRAKYTKITLDKAYRLEHLVNEFFDITRFNLSTIPLEKELIPVAVMFEQMVEEFYPMLADGNRKVVLSIDENLRMYGDADKLARVFNNILKNAIAYSYEQSAIVIEAVEVTMLKITFTNHGKTIPQSKINAIFEKFFRLDMARSTNGGGAGLGLSIAKEIVVQHGGEIFATSVEEESVFTVLLPLYSNRIAS